MLTKLFGTAGTSRRPRHGLAALLVVAAGAAIAWALIAHAAAARQAGCPAGPFGLTRQAGQCVGVTDGSYAFSPALAGVEHDIARQNAAATGSGNYVTVALLTQFTEGPGSLVSAPRILDELRGAYAEQFSADSASYQDIRPRIQLLLANEGNQEVAWRAVTRQLAALASGPAHLVAVIGMGISDTQTMAGGQVLSRAGIPMIGSVITADGLDWRNVTGLVRVVPSNGTQIAALRDYVAAHGGLHRSLLIEDSNTSDLYTANLATDLQADFTGHVVMSKTFEPAGSPGDQFALFALQVCPDPAGTPAVVLYAGRDVVLQQLISQIKQTPNCVGKQVTILTGSDASALDAGVTRGGSGTAQVTVYYSNLLNTAAVTQPVQGVFAASGLGAAASEDGTWTGATYNAMSAAATAIRAAARNSSVRPSLATVLGCLRLFSPQAPISGATGPFYFTNSGEEAGLNVPIFRDSGGSVQVLVP